MELGLAGDHVEDAPEAEAVGGPGLGEGLPHAGHQVLGAGAPLAVDPQHRAGAPGAHEQVAKEGVPEGQVSDTFQISRGKQI